MNAKSSTTFVDDFGQRIFTHPATRCIGEFCTIHKPSNHHMRTMRQFWRHDRGIMERICQHGVGHPDPDDITRDTSHCCDGCCIRPDDR